jgi:hypothetical protein
VAEACSVAGTGTGSGAATVALCFADLGIEFKETWWECEGIKLQFNRKRGLICKYVQPNPEHPICTVYFPSSGPGYKIL